MIATFDEETKAAYNLAAFFSRLREVKNRALLLDYDGTLAPFKLKREKAVLYPGLRKTLNCCLKSDLTRVVIITGRTIDSLLPLLNLERTPEIWGLHGLERLLPDGTYSSAPLSGNVLRGLAEADRWIEDEGLTALCEHKRGGMAVHTRGLQTASAKKIISTIRKGLKEIASNRGLVLHQFDGGIELRVEGVNKGIAVATILDELGKNSLAAYLGDDLTDEDAFRAMHGRGVSILVRKTFRPTAADLWLKPPEELLNFLEGWLEAVGGKTWQDMLKGDSS